MSPISDCNISEKPDLINWVEEENEFYQIMGLLTKIFAVSQKGLLKQAISE